MSGAGPRYDQPGVVPLRPLRAGDILAGVVRAVRANPVATLGISFAVALLGSLANWLGNVNFDVTVVDDRFVVVDPFTPVEVSILTASLLAVAILQGVLSVVVLRAAVGRTASLGAAWRVVRPRLLPLIGFQAVQAAVVLSPFILPVIQFIHALNERDGAAAVGTLVYLFLAAIPAVYLGVRTSLGTSALLWEGLGVTGAWRRTWALTRDDFWRLFGVQLLAGLVITVINSAVEALAPGTGGILGQGMPALSDPAFAANPWGSVLVGSLAVAVTAPIQYGTLALLYLDQRVRRERYHRQLLDDGAPADPGWA